MLTLTIKGQDLFDERQQKFIVTKGQTLVLEHSLVSISKWEAKWKKSFFRKEPKTVEETIDYIRCMTITQNVDPNVYLSLTNADVTKVMDYMNDPMTATTVNRVNRSKNGNSVITSEVIYYYMTAYNIPFEPCQKWHFNRLMMLIQVCDEKNAPSKKMSRRQAADRYSKVNSARRAAMHTRG